MPVATAFIDWQAASCASSEATRCCSSRICLPTSNVGVPSAKAARQSSANDRSPTNRNAIIADGQISSAMEVQRRCRVSRVRLVRPEPTPYRRPESSIEVPTGRLARRPMLCCRLRPWLCVALLAPCSVASRGPGCVSPSSPHALVPAVVLLWFTLAAATKRNKIQ